MGADIRVLTDVGCVVTLTYLLWLVVHFIVHFIIQPPLSLFAHHPSSLPFNPSPSYHSPSTPLQPITSYPIPSLTFSTSPSYHSSYLSLTFSTSPCSSFKFTKAVSPPACTETGRGVEGAGGWRGRGMEGAGLVAMSEVCCILDMRSGDIVCDIYRLGSTLEIYKSY